MRLGTAVTVAVIATIAVSAREVAGRIAKASAGVGLLRIRAIEVAASAASVFFSVSCC
jgi:nickel/cobalt transporter (NicO) family protein